MKQKNGVEGPADSVEREDACCGYRSTGLLCGLRRAVFTSHRRLCDALPVMGRAMMVAEWVLMGKLGQTPAEQERNT
ncbi:unnamed protein product [Merluccius merluccius]